jgi:DNA-directed RNA polymerase subunit H (RpoH/RPB5)
MVAKTQNSTIVSDIYHSRSIILNLLKRRGFDVDDYDGASINEINIMNNNNQLDLYLTNPKTQKKVYVKYHLKTKIRPANVYDYIEELFNLEDILSISDDLIIITKEGINDTLRKLIDNIYKTEGYYVNIYFIKKYKFNVLEHNLVPPHRICSEEEKLKIEEQYNIMNKSQFPEISRLDPVAIAIGARPGDLVEITRSSPTSLTSKYYRLCI